MKDTTMQQQCLRKKKLWETHIRAWGNSGLTQNEYCRRNKLRSNQFCYWKKKLRQQSKISSSFVPVPIQSLPKQCSPENSNSGLSIFLSNGIKIELNRDFNAAALSRVVVALGERLC